MARLDDADIEARLKGLGGWDRDGDALRREFQFTNFVGSVDFINRITPVAEELNHHPDLEVSWSTVVVKLSTHSAGGITEADFDLATRIDGLA